MLYMLFFASCIHSLKKSQLETKRVGNKRQAYKYKKSFLVLLTNLRKKIKKLKKSFSDFYANYFLIHMMFANNLFCLFRPCKQFFSIFFIPPLQKNNGPSLIMLSRMMLPMHRQTGFVPMLQKV